MPRERIDWLRGDRGGLDERIRPVRLGRVGVFATVQTCSLAANVIRLDHEIPAEFALDAEVPVLHIRIAEVGIHVIRTGIELAGPGIFDQVADERFGWRHRDILEDTQCLLIFFDIWDVLDDVFSNNALDGIEKYAIATADRRLFEGSPRKTKTGPEIFLVHREDRARELDAGAPPGRRLLQALQREELCRPLGIAAGTALRKDQRRYPVARVFRRNVEHITQAEVERQFRAHLPVVLNECGVLSRA